MKIKLLHLGTKFEQDRAHLMYDCTRTREIEKLQRWLCTCMAFPYTTRTHVFNYHYVISIRAEQLEPNAISCEATK